MARLDSVNIGRPRPNPHKESGWTGIGKQPTLEAVKVRAPGPKTSGLGSGLVGDFIGDGKHHGGDSQAVYAFQREDLDEWERRLERELPSGFFGENLTTVGLEINDARIGERWRVGSEVVLQVTAPRIPCATFRGWMGEKGWAKRFTAAGRPGAYLSVIDAGHYQDRRSNRGHSSTRSSSQHWPRFPGDHDRAQFAPAAAGRRALSRPRHARDGAPS